MIHVKMEPGWKKLLEEEFQKDYFSRLAEEGIREGDLSSGALDLQSL
jgi:hypothetical protein